MRNQVPSDDELLAGNRRALAKAITLIESQLPEHRDQAASLLDSLMPHTGGSVRIGISGAPGVGKSTFIESFGLSLLNQGRRVAVLAVDPSSPVGGGSILGDKTRMQELSRHANAFIRPSPAGGALGGVAHKTRESILLCEATGFDVVLVETVGVGQSEYDVSSMTDFFLVLLLPNAGDELQGIKKGIIELADALVINKADGDNIRAAESTRAQYQSALKLLAQSAEWEPRVLCCSAQEQRGIGEIWSMICDFHRDAMASGRLLARRASQAGQWVERLLVDMLDEHLHADPALRARHQELIDQVRNGATTPLAAATALFRMLVNK